MTVAESGAEAARGLLHEAELIGPPREGEALLGNHRLVIAVAVLGGGAITALVAWLLLCAAG